MKVAFIASSLEPGKDGVGDYTRRLAAECVRQGHAAALLALNDDHVSRLTHETQESEGISLPSFRVPRGMSWRLRVTEAREWLKGFHPDWVSLQFVLFGFHPRGLCFGLGKRLASINAQAPWHIMFHELWVGLGEGSSTKHRLWGATQKSIVRAMTRRLQPRAVHTQAEPYRRVLDQAGIRASVLRLFGNIPYARPAGADDGLDPLVRQALTRAGSRSKLYLVGVFGGVHPEWNAADAVTALAPLMQRFQKRLVLVFLGKSGLGTKAWQDLQQRIGTQADVIVTGERSDREISILLQSLDLGLATSPRQIIEKSGSVAAMLEHGLPVLVTRDDWRLKGTKSEAQASLSRLLGPKQLELLSALPTRNSWHSHDWGVGPAARQMLVQLRQTCPAE